MAKVKKAQDGWVLRAATHRGVCGKGSISDRRAARMDRKELKRNARLDRRDERQGARESRREEKRWQRMNLKTGGVAKAQKGKTISYTTPRGTRVTTDTSGYSSGARRFASMSESGSAKGYGMIGRKNTKKQIEMAEGKRPVKNLPLTGYGSKKAKTTFGKAKSAKKAKTGTTTKKAFLGIGVDKETRQQRRYGRQSARQMRRSERTGLGASRSTYSRQQGRMCKINRM